MRLKDKTPLQKKIFKAISGHEIGEVIHAFALIKIALFFDKTLLAKESKR